METPTPPNESSAFLDEFLVRIQDFEDYRVERTKEHPLPMLMFAAIGSCLTGGESFNDMEAFAHAHQDFLRTHLGLLHPPSHDTFNRLFQMIRPECFNAFLSSFAEGLRRVAANAAAANGDTMPEVIAFDGKTTRRSHTGATPALHTLNVWAGRNRLIIGQLAVDAKSNEITAVPELMKTLSIKGCVVTADALNTQKDIAAQAVSQGADYLLPLKGNHPLAAAEVGAFMEDLASRREPGFESVEKGHGRVETRRVWQSADVAWFADGPQWKGLRSFALLRAVREFPDGRREESQRLYLSSLGMDEKRLAHAARAHWGVENACHWCLDVTFGEDQCRARSRNAAGNLGALRKHSLNLLRLSGEPMRMKHVSLRGKRYFASLNFEYLLSIICVSQIKDSNQIKI